jgi:hypothetical protein
VRESIERGRVAREVDTPPAPATPPCASPTAQSPLTHLACAWPKFFFPAFPFPSSPSSFWDAFGCTLMIYSTRCPPNAPCRELSVGASRSRAQRDMRGAKQLRSHVQQPSAEQFVWSMYATSAAYLLMCVCVSSGNLLGQDRAWRSL